MNCLDRENKWDFGKQWKKHWSFEFESLLLKKIALIERGAGIIASDSKSVIFVNIYFK